MECFGTLADLPSLVNQYRENIWTTKRLFSKQRVTDLTVGSTKKS